MQRSRDLMKYEEELARLRTLWKEDPAGRWKYERMAKMINNAKEMHLKKHPQQTLLDDMQTIGQHVE